MNLRRALFSCAVVVSFWCGPRAGAALVDLELAVTPLSGAFHYDATIRNNGLIDLTLVSILDAPIADPLIDPSLSAPAGFVALYDSTLGIIDFLEDTTLFGAGQTVSGFSFNSSVMPGSFYTTFRRSISMAPVSPAQSRLQTRLEPFPIQGPLSPWALSPSR
jgi:hypothetical protein